MDRERFETLTRLITADRERFDALSRRISAKQSRRIVMAGLAGSVLLGRALRPAMADSPAECREKDGKDKRQCRRKHRANSRGGEWCGPVSFPCTVGITKCCKEMVCTPSAALLVTGCQAKCNSDDECRSKFGNSDWACRPDALVCPFLGKCCVPTNLE